MSIVDQECKTRMNAGFRERFGEDMDNEEYRRLLRLAGLVRMSPLVNSFAEIDKAIQTISKGWKPKKQYA